MAIEIQHTQTRVGLRCHILAVIKKTCVDPRVTKLEAMNDHFPLYQSIPVIYGF